MGMSGFVIALLIIAMLLTLGVLFTGIVSFAVGGDFSKRNSNKLMRARVLCQGVALALFAVAVLLSE